MVKYGLPLRVRLAQQYPQYLGAAVALPLACHSIKQVIRLREAGPINGEGGI